MKVLIGSAWPYANGLHIGHLAALLPADTLARYHRARGDEVFFVSGTDCHGTPVTLRAREEGKTPREVSDFYHAEFVECFNRLGFSYDHYGKTSDESHQSFVRAFHKHMYKGPHVYEGETRQAYCESCECFLADRYVTGLCPSCGKSARGDQCEACGTVLEPEQLVEPRCGVCGEAPVFKPTRHLFLSLAPFEARLREWSDAQTHWRKNAINLTRRYLDEGLPDRALTRDLDWGIPVPKPGYENKSIYIWAENVLGYLSASSAITNEADYQALWFGDNARHYYVHGKDNVPFHTLILPALLMAYDDACIDELHRSHHLPDRIVSSEHLTLEGRKISSSQNWAIWVKDLLNEYQPDAIRYFLLANGPEKRDQDFSRRVFALCINGELLGVYGNFVNRTLVFVHKYMGGVVPDTGAATHFDSIMEDLYPEVGKKIEEGRFKDALDRIFAFLREANQFYDAEKPWETRKTDPAACARTLGICTQIVANACVWLEPFLPFSSGKIRGWLGLDASWQLKKTAPGTVISQPEILFERIEV